MSYLLGIDLGTTFTAAAVQRLRGDEATGEPEMVALGAHAPETASVVLLGEDGSLLVGDAAERRATAEPDRVAREFKRRIGDPTPVSLGGHPFSAEELAALLVRHVVEEAAAREGGPAERIAVTHPASWGAHKRELLAGALADALIAAGVTAPVQFLSEPVAAAVCYAAAERVESGSTIAVYDLGGGTFDAAVVRKDGSAAGFTLLGRPEGLEFLGGVDFDEVVFDHVRAGAPGVFDGLDDADPNAWAAVARLRRECREAKEALSADTEVVVPVWLGASSTVVRLHRGEFEELIGPRVGETVEALSRAVTSAGVTDPGQLSSVLLVGGSSRIPLVAQLVSEGLDRPVAVDADPRGAIAKGAALALLPSRASWPAVQVPPQRAVPAETDAERTGPLVPVLAHAGHGNDDDPPTDWFPAVGAEGPATLFAPPVHPADGDTSYVTQDVSPAAGRADRARWLIGAGGVAGALAILAAVLFWPGSSPTLDGASARSIVPDTAVPTTAPALPGPVVGEPTPAPADPRATTGGTSRDGTPATPGPVAGPAPAPIVGPAPGPPPGQSGPAGPVPNPGTENGNNGETGTKPGTEPGTKPGTDPVCPDVPVGETPASPAPSTTCTPRANP